MYPESITIDDLRPVSEAPEGVTILVYLAEKIGTSRWHLAIIHPNVIIVGGRFGFDAPKILGWIPIPTVEEPEQC